MKHTIRFTFCGKLSRPIYIAIALLALAMILTPIHAAQAAPRYTIVVNSTIDSVAQNDGLCTLREAIINANHNDQSGSIDCAPGQSGADTIVFTVSGTITLINYLPNIAEDLTIYGPPNGITISGGDSLPIFYVNNAVVLNLLSLTITHAYINNDVGAGIYNSAGQVNISNSTISYNSACSGAGIYNYVGVVVVDNSSFSHNSVCGAGAAIFNDGGELVVFNSTFSNNNAVNGGAIFNSCCEMIIDGSTFSNNIAIFTLSSPSSAQPSAKSVSGHTTRKTNAPNQVANGSGDGGAIVSVGGTAAISNSSFVGNMASSSGGALLNFDSSLDIASSTFSGNSAYEGGGLYNNFGILTLSRSTVSGNGAVNGGGLFAIDNVAVSNSTFSGNLASLAHSSPSFRAPSNLKRPSNGSEDGGGILLQQSGTMTVTNSTIAGNTATSYGGGIGMIGTIGMYTMTLRNSIVAQNTGPAFFDNCGGTVTDGGNNIDGTTSCGLVATSSMSNTNPLLSSLGNYGGPTQTRGLLLRSPAIDAANPIYCPPIDQRGVYRPSGPVCDIGAFEGTVRLYLLPMIFR